MSHDAFWLVDRKALNAMNSVNMSCVLFIWLKVNIYNKDKDKDKDKDKMIRKSTPDQLSNLSLQILPFVETTPNCMLTLPSLNLLSLRLSQFIWHIGMLLRLKKLYDNLLFLIGSNATLMVLLLITLTLLLVAVYLEFAMLSS